jgi:hypothetical protein
MSRTHAPVRRAPVPAAALLVAVGGQPERGAARGYAGADGKASVAVSRK